MGKSTYFTGQPVYTQVINLLDKAKIKQLSHQTIGSEKYVKRLDGWTHLIIMLFGVLRHYDSLRELEIGIKAEINKLNHLGIDYVVRRSTFAEQGLNKLADQGNLFDNVDREKQTALVKAIDAINRKNGYNKIRVAVQGDEKGWQMKREYISKQYTTNLEDVIVLKVK